MRILISGGAGFVGYHTVKYALSRGHDVTVFDNFSTGRKENVFPMSIFHKRDISEYVLWTSKWEFDAIIHLAAQPSLRFSISNQMFDAQTNILGTINMIQLAKTHKECHFVLAFTSAVYDDTGSLPYTEGDDLSPHLPYGMAKASAEMYVSNLCPSYSILRYGNVYGERQVEIGENQLVPHAIRYLLDDDPFKINGDGESFRDFIYAGDIARANVIACEKKVNGVFNIGTGQDLTVNRIWNILNGFNSKDESGIGKFVLHGEAKEGEARGVSLNVDKAWRELGWRAEVNISEGLKKTMESWKTEREFYK